MNNTINKTETIYVANSILNSGYKLGELRRPTWRYIRTSVRGNLRDWTIDRVRSLIIDDIWSDIDDAG